MFEREASQWLALSEAWSASSSSTTTDFWLWNSESRGSFIVKSVKSLLAQNRAQLEVANMSKIWFTLIPQNRAQLRWSLMQRGLNTTEKLQIHRPHTCLYPS